MSQRTTTLEKWEAVTEYPLMGLSLLFLIILILPIAHPLTHHQRAIIDVIDIAIWAIFALDYFGKLAIAPDKWDYIKKHVVELLIVALPLLRPLRLIRLVPVIGYFLQYTRRTLSGRLLQYVSMATVLICTASAVTMYEIEKAVKGSNIKTLGDAIWWTISTVTTVGYGDRFPTTAAGRVLAVLVMFTGISLIGVITASIAAWFVSSDESTNDQIQMQQLMTELQEIKAALKKSQEKG